MLNRLFESMLEQDREPIVVCDAESVIVYMNPRQKPSITGI